MKKEILELVSLVEEVYENTDALIWEEIFYKIEKLKETITND